MGSVKFHDKTAADTFFLAKKDNNSHRFCAESRMELIILIVEIIGANQHFAQTPVFR
jgi:hypothetical protein